MRLDDAVLIDNVLGQIERQVEEEAKKYPPPNDHAPFIFDATMKMGEARRFVAVLRQELNGG